nr:MAG: RNA dependent RNA polymerase [Ustilaginoidea virens partitivirus 11]
MLIHMAKRYAVPRVKALVDATDPLARRAAAVDELRRRSAAAGKAKHHTRLWAISEIERRLDEANVIEYVAAWSVRLLPHEQAEFLRLHARWFVGARRCEKRLLRGCDDHKSVAYGAPPEVPPAVISRRLARTTGTRPLKIGCGDDLPLATYIRKVRPDLFSRLPQGGVFTPTGSFDASAPHLGKYFGEEPPAPDRDEVAGVILNCAESLKVIRLGELSPAAFETTGVKPDAAPGFDSKLFCRTKGEGMDIVAHACKQLYELLAHEQVLDASAWELGGREKRQWRDVGEALASRVIMQPEALLSQFGCAIAHPITLAMQRAKGDLHVGWSFAHGKWRDFVSKYSGEHVKAFDWSQFDARVGRELMITSMGILRSYYPPGRQMDRCFIYLLSNMLDKDVVVPGGHIARVSWGVPSGHPFTSLVDSVANWLVHRDCLTAMVGPGVAREVRLGCLGDDTVMSFPVGRDAPDTKEYLEVALARWGMVGKLDFNLEGFLCSNWAPRCLPFLGTRFQCGFPGVSLEDWITMDLGDRAPRRDYAWRALELYVYRGLPPFCKEQYDLHAALCRWLVDQTGDHPIVNSPTVEWLITSVYEFAALVYLTKDTGYYAWAEDMQGSRSVWADLPPRVKRGSGYAQSDAEVFSRLTPRGREAWNTCINNAHWRIHLDPFTGGFYWFKDNGE